MPDPHSKPKLAVTVGDVAGVGPEVSLKCASNPSVLERCTPILLGPSAAIATVAERLRLPMPPVVTSEHEVDGQLSGPLVFDVCPVSLSGLAPGTFSRDTGRASFEAVCRAIEMALDARVGGIVTGPIQKEAWHAAETGYLGHTELLADRTGTTEFCMMLSGQACSTVLVSIHLPLLDAVKSLSVESIERAIRLGASAMQTRHGRPPRVTVLGLNPHAGENGLLSRGEEETLIVPAMERAARWAEEQGAGWVLEGPVPPDTAFTPAMRERTDVHICMYHDQGLIPLKALSFDDGVNVTLGLPIIRTSVDHGTAMDLAWKGTASPNSMRAAIEMAVDLCRK